MKSHRPSHDEISARAYQIFVERGCPEGRDLEHWLEAEAQLSGEPRKSKSAPPAEKQTPPKAEKASLRQSASRRM